MKDAIQVIYLAYEFFFVDDSQRHSLFSSHNLYGVKNSFSS